MLTEPMEPAVTPRQLEVLRRIGRDQDRQCYSATMGELAQEMGVSRPTVFEHIAALREKGLVTKSRGRARSLQLTAQASRLLERERGASQEIQDTSLPFLGRVAAGAPIEAIENAEPISLAGLFGDDDTFVLEVIGDSMIEEGICDGDYAICKRAETAENGQLVVAIVDEENATMKRFYRESGRVRLQPANSRYKPIFSDNCRIEAVVIGLLRRL
ncbi:MAG: transcriptional repressor LexA [Sedimentisphaerales bacterium]|nr:transcriptional repressor LexA [Sedimentisphaerales bacterium]